MFTHLKELIKHKELFFIWTARDVKVRYKQTLIGVLWALFRPFATMVVFTVIFSKFFSVPSEGIPYPIFSFSALVPWMFFATSVTTGVASIVNNMGLVTKIYFPREIFPFSSIGAASVDFGISFCLLLVMMIFYRTPVTPWLLFVPVLVLIQIILSAGISLLASAANVFYRDIRFIFELGVQLWMYLTPVIYSVDAVPERFIWLYMANPMAPIIDSYRKILVLGQPPEWRFLGMAAGVSLLIFIIGYRYFKKMEGKFADII